MEKFKIVPDVEQAKLIIDKQVPKMKDIEKIVASIALLVGFVSSELVFYLVAKDGASHVFSFVVALLFFMLIEVLFAVPWSVYKNKARDYTVSQKILEIMTGNYTIVDFKVSPIPCIYYVDNSDPQSIVNTLFMNEYAPCESLTVNEATIDLINFRVITKYDS